MNYVIKMSASFRTLWVHVRGRWSIQGENKVYVFRRTVLFLTPGTGLRGGDRLSFSPRAWCELKWDRSPAPALLLAQLGLAQCSSVSPVLCRQGPSAPLLWHCRDRQDALSCHSFHLAGGSFCCLGWCQSWAVWAWSECELGLCSRSVFLASVMDLGC